MRPASGLCDVAVDAGAPLIVINAEETPYDDLAAEVLRGPIGEILPAVTRDLT